MVEEHDRTIMCKKVSERRLREGYISMAFAILNVASSFRAMDELKTCIDEIVRALLSERGYP